MNRFKELPFLLAIILLLSMILSPFASTDEPEKLNVVSLGDSITYGYGLSEPSKAYPHLIGNGSNHVTNISYPGWTSTDLLTDLKANQAAAAKLQEADVITLNIGANDLMQAIGIGEIIASQQPFVPTEEHLAKIDLASNQLAVNLQEMITIIRANSAAPILLYSIYNPFGPSQDPFAASLHMLGEQVTTNVNTLVIGPLSSVTGAIYLDTNSTFNDNQLTYIIPGDIHPTLAGHKALAKLATNAWIAVQPPKEEITIEEAMKEDPEEVEPPAENKPSNIATSMFSFLTVGFCLIGAGAGVFIIQRIRKLKSEKTHF